MRLKEPSEYSCTSTFVTVLLVWTVWLVPRGHILKAGDPLSSVLKCCWEEYAPGSNPVAGCQTEKQPRRTEWGAEVRGARGSEEG